MNETNNPETPDQPEPITRLVDHPNWQLDDCGGSLKQVRTAIERKGNTELRFSHTETSGVLLVELPRNGEREDEIQGMLQQALDHRQQSNPETDPFLNELITVQAAIAERYEREGITALRDPVSILRIEFSSDCNGEIIDQMLSDVASASREIHCLHQELMRLLREYPE